MEAVAPATSQAPHTPPSDTLTARELAPGVAYRQFADASGPWVMYLVRVDLQRIDIELRHVRALNNSPGVRDPRTWPAGLRRLA